MQHLPSDEPKKTKQLRMASSYYDDIFDREHELLVLQR